MRKVEVSALRRDIFAILTSLMATGPVEITRHGKVIATLAGPSKSRQTGKPAINKRRLQRLCKRHHIKRLALFGSILRDDFGPESDVDILIDPEPGRMRTFHERLAAEDALAKLFGRPIDLLKRAVVEQSTNAVRRRSILENSRVIYEAT